MFIFAQLIGVFIISAGIAIAFKPQIASDMVAFWEKDHRLYWGGIIRLVFGSIMLVTASDARFPTLVMVLGILFFLSGLLLYILPEAKIRGILEWWKQRSIIVVRVWGSIAALLGLLILYAV